MILTSEQLKQIIPNNKNIDEWCISLNKILPLYEINTTKRIAMFIAQCAHESGNFTALTENLYYRAEALMRTWPTRFPSMVIAEQYAMKPEKIANRAYCDRMGNGNEASGDGWKYRGKGLIQVTGHDNTMNFAKTKNMTAEQAADYLITFDGAVESACWYWKVNNINPWCDLGDVERVTKIINGGYNGLEDRKSKYTLAMKIFE
jgi:putative chitinase